MSEPRPKTVPMKRLGIRGFLRLAGLVLLAASVIRELRLPKAERTWHGVVFGKVPYDLRPPTFERLKGAFCNPDNPEIVVPTAFGVGWSVNVAALCMKLGPAAAMCAKCMQPAAA
jgi:Family of unknown function (DUF5808)